MNVTIIPAPPRKGGATLLKKSGLPTKGTWIIAGDLFEYPVKIIRRIETYLIGYLLQIEDVISGKLIFEE